MGSVLLAAPPAKTEVVNDLDDHIVTIWRWIRDDPDTLQRLVHATPEADTENKRARHRLNTNPDGSIEHARAALVVLSMCFGKSFAKGMNHYVPRKYRYLRVHHDPLNTIDIGSLAARIRSIKIHCKDACEVIGWYSQCPKTTIYCDPPYKGREDKYRMSVDREALERAIRDATARIAISGYSGEWDHLEGWTRHERRARSQLSNSSNPAHSGRTETLWTNWPGETGHQQDLFAAT